MERFVVIISIYASLFALFYFLLFLLLLSSAIGKSLVIKKIGDKWWKGFIPLYGTYTLFKKTKTDTRLFYLYLLSLILSLFWFNAHSLILRTIFCFLTIIIYVFSLKKMYTKLTLMLNVTTDYVIGLIIINQVFYLLLGLDENARMKEETIESKEPEAEKINEKKIEEEKMVNNEETQVKENLEEVKIEETAEENKRESATETEIEENGTGMIEEEVKICPRCGASITKNAAFCQHCGQDQSKKVRKRKMAEEIQG